MDFLIILAAFLGIVWYASSLDAKLQAKYNPKKPDVCPPHPWRQKKAGEPGTHYLICDKCGVEPSFVGRDTPQK